MTQPADTQAERAAELMQRDILTGTRAPGARPPVRDIAVRCAIVYPDSAAAA